MGLTWALADHAQHPVAAVLPQVGHVSGARLVNAQRVVQQQPHKGGRPERLLAGVGVGGGDQGAGLIAVQADRGGVVRIHGRALDTLGRMRAVRSWAAQ